MAGSGRRRNPKIRRTSIMVLERRKRVRRDWLNGVVIQEELAARHNVSQPTIHRDLCMILEQMRAEDSQLALVEKRTQQQRLMRVVMKAADGYERSRLDSEEVTETVTPEICPDCKGSGWQDADERTGEWCELCGGSGRIEVRVVQRRVKGKAGDPSFLKTQLETLKEINRISGLHPQKTKQGDHHDHSHVHNQIDLTNATTEDLLQLKKLASRMNQKTIDVEVVDVEGSG